MTICRDLDDSISQFEGKMQRQRETAADVTDILNAARTINDFRQKQSFQRKSRRRLDKRAWFSRPFGFRLQCSLELERRTIQIIRTTLEIPAAIKITRTIIVILQQTHT